MIKLKKVKTQLVIDISLDILSSNVLILVCALRYYFKSENLMSDFLLVYKLPK